MADIVHDRVLDAERGHSHTLDSEIKEIQVGKKRQVVGILVSIALVRSPRGLIRFLGVAIRHHDTFCHHRSNISDHSGPRVWCVVLFTYIDRYRAQILSQRHSSWLLFFTSFLRGYRSAFG